MKKSSFLLGSGALVSSLFWFQAAQAESCFKVNIKQKIDIKKCESVPVILTAQDCNDDKKTIEEKVVNASVDCSANPPHLKMKYHDQVLQSTLEPAQMWGGVNYRVTATTVEILTAENHREPASVVKTKKARAPLPEKQVQEHAEAAAKDAKIKDASTGQVAPAESSGSIVVTPSKGEDNAAKIVKEETKVEAPVPLNVKFSGFAWIETEDSRNFGYNGKSGIRNFDASVPGSQQAFSSFLSNLQLDISKDKTNFTTVLEIGEIINGEASTGGAQGGRINVMEVRNAYLTHEVNTHWAFKAGLLPVSSDPNSFIVSDHFSAAVAEYKKENLTGSLWSAKAFGNKPGVVVGGAGAVNTDQYWGLSLQPKFSETSKLTAYAVLRRTTESLVDSATATKVDGLSQYSWYGGTYDLTLGDHWSIQGTGILNDSKFSNADGVSDSYKATLLDAKVMASWKEAGFDLLLEGLATSGASGSVDSTQGASIVGARRGFNSPDPGAAYLFTIATSDGADDAPGAPKESIIANLSQPEGLRIVLVKATQTFNDKWSGFVRLGKIQTASASMTTGSRELGDEFDLNATYELSPGTTLQLDYGYLRPGAFFEQRDVAQMLTTRLKFSF
jgi:hypothetical protein